MLSHYEINLSTDNIHASLLLMLQSQNMLITKKHLWLHIKREMPNLQITKLEKHDFLESEVEYLELTMCYANFHMLQSK